MDNVLSGPIIYRKEYPLAWVEINRPHALNALNKETFSKIGDIVDDVSSDKHIKVVILTGHGEKAFAAGADIEELKFLTPIAARKFALAAYNTQTRISKLNQVTIAAINGFALGGGCELAMCCDLRIASDRAKFGQPEINLGIIPGGGGTQRLARLVGVAKTKELIFTGKIISAEEALRIGLINIVVKTEELLEKTRNIAMVIAGKSGPAISFAKKSINNGIDMNLDDSLNYEIECFAECFSTEDHREGIEAFLSKRDACFKNQ